jgi:uncharacterized protein GlcG (DUF336 family)
MTSRRLCAGLALLLAGAPLAGLAADPARYSVQLMTPETALRAAQAALSHCRKQGWQASVAVVDRGGLLQVLLRDRFAGPHTPGVAQDKAWTAASFRMPTTLLAREAQPGQAMSGLRSHDRVLAAGGGLPIEAGGALFGAIAVSGAPGGEADDACAKAGIEAIAADLEL